MYQLYEAKKNETLEAAGNKALYQDFLSSINESYSGAWNFGFMYIYSAWLLFMLLLSFMFLFTLKSVACKHRRLYCVSPEVPVEIIHQNPGGCYGN